MFLLLTCAKRIITILRRIQCHANKLLIGLENSRERSFESETKTKTAKFRSRAVSRPRPRSLWLYLWRALYEGLWRMRSCRTCYSVSRHCSSYCIKTGMWTKQVAFIWYPDDWLCYDSRIVVTGSTGWTWSVDHPTFFRRCFWYRDYIDSFDVWVVILHIPASGTRRDFFWRILRVLHCPSPMESRM